MTEPKRLFDTGSDFERRLLRDGRNEKPSRLLEPRLLASLAAIPVAEALDPDPPKPPRTSPRADTRIPWLSAPRGFGLAAAVIGIGAVVALSRRGDPPAPPPPDAPVVVVPAVPPPPEVVPTPVTPIVTPDSLPTAKADPTPAGAQPSSAATPAPSPEAGPSIAREIELLDLVKAKLGASFTADAMRALDAYDREFPQGALRPEATVLRIRALLLQGKRAEAQQLADTFLAQQPGSVHARRVRALLGE